MGDRRARMIQAFVGGVVAVVVVAALSGVLPEPFFTAPFDSHGCEAPYEAWNGSSQACEAVVEATQIGVGFAVTGLYVVGVLVWIHRGGSKRDE